MSWHIVGLVLAAIGGITVGLLLITWAMVLGKTLASWLRYKRAQRRLLRCCPACQLQATYSPPRQRGPLMESAARARVKAEEERRINGTADDFDPLARVALGGHTLSAKREISPRPPKGGTGVSSPPKDTRLQTPAKTNVVHNRKWPL